MFIYANIYRKFLAVFSLRQLLKILTVYGKIISQNQNRAENVQFINEYRLDEKKRKETTF